MRKPKIIIKKAGKGNKQFMVVVVGANGRVLMTSEILNTRRGAINNIDATAHAFFNFDSGISKISEE